MHEAGFSSIMFDGSHYPIEENVAKTKELAAICKEKRNVSGGRGRIYWRRGRRSCRSGECADPNECKMIADLGVDMLAAGIGNIHGVYPENWQGLSFETLDAIQALTGDMPLVLHGGTGIPDDMIKKAISLGVARSMLIQNVSLYLLKLHASILKQVRIKRKKASILVNY